MMRKKQGLWLVIMMTVLAVVLAACGGSDDQEKQDEVASSNAAGTYVTLDVNAAYERMRANGDAIIVDVREPSEWAATGVPVDAELISLGQFVANGAPSELPKDQEIFVICNSGNRSRTAADVLARSGYANVVNIDGGIQAWLKAGLPVEPYQP